MKWVIEEQIKRKGVTKERIILIVMFKFNDECWGLYKKYNIIKKYFYIINFLVTYDNDKDISK